MMTIVDQHIPGIIKTPSADTLKKLLRGEPLPPSFYTEQLIWFQFWSMSDANLLHCFDIARGTKNRSIVRLYLDVMAKRGYGVKLWHDEGKMYLKLFYENEDREVETFTCADEEEWQMFMEPPEVGARVPPAPSKYENHLYKALLPMDSIASKTPGVRLDIVVDKNKGGVLGWWQKNTRDHVEGRVIYVTEDTYLQIVGIEEPLTGDRILHVWQRQDEPVERAPWNKSITERDPLE